LASAQILMKQCEQLIGNPDMNPVLIQWTSTAQPGQFSSPHPHDGWYLISDWEPNYRDYVVTGTVGVSATMSLVEPMFPSPLSVGSAGGASLASTFLQVPTLPLLAFPVGSTLIPPFVLASRTGGEGAIPLSLPGTNPARFAPPGTLAGLFTGGSRVYDTINTGSNPIPTSGGTFVNANWIQVYGLSHNFIGDCIITNGLLLLFFHVGGSGLPSVYIWNTVLGTPSWQLIGQLEYTDSAANLSTIQSFTFEKIGLQEARIRTLAATSIAWAQLKWKLVAGRYDTWCEFMPLSENNSVLKGVDFVPQQTVKAVYDESSVVDAVVQTNTAVTPSINSGHSAAIGLNANQPLCGWLFQNPPGTGQPYVIGSSEIGNGDASGPAQNTFRRYGFFAVPFSTTPANLQSEGESGSLGTGWSSVVDAGSSAGSAAKAASGTLTGNADLFGTSWVPPGGAYHVWIRLRVTSNASATVQMQSGLWDTTAGAFMAGASRTDAPNAFATTYLWVKCTAATVPVVPTAGHNMQFRVVTTATLTTDWFIDEAILAPAQSVVGTPGEGNFPGDIWYQGMFERDARWIRG
jgi:hypothetical protein